MAYDEFLTRRFRDAMGDLDGIVEKRMVGGVCFMWNGNMVGGADRTKTGQGRFMFRVGKDNEAAAARPDARIMEMAGRRMAGFYFVDEAATDDALKEWMELALGFVGTLRPK